MLNVKELIHYKSSTTAVFLGSGRSINFIAPEGWEKIKGCDIWTVNNWIYHPFIVPDFYHIEVKHYNYKLMQRRIREKIVSYRNVKFIFPRNKRIKVDSKRLPLHEVVPNGMFKFDYYLEPRDPRRTDSPFHAKYKMREDRLTKSYDMSITAVFELMFKLGYLRIVTFGIDLKDSYYFWSDGNPCYGEVHHLTNKAHENKPPEEPHATHKIKDFLVDFDRRWMRKNGEGIFVVHMSTLLYPEIEYMPVMEL